MSSRRKIGIALLGDYYQPNEIVEYAVAVEQAGFHSVWVPEHYCFTEAFTLLGAAAKRTNTIKLGTAVVSVLTRHPALLAMAAATLDALSSGRAMLGLGTGRRFWIENSLGISLTSPTAVIRESVEIIRRLLRGERVVYGGRFFKAANLSLGFETVSQPPIYLAAVGPGMQRLAGRVADGVIFSGASSPSYTAHAVSNIKASCAKHGRNPEEFEYISLIVTSVDTNSATARDRVKPLVATILSTPGRAEMMLSEITLRRLQVDRMRKAVTDGNLNRATRYIGDEVAEEVTAAGTVEQAIDALKKHVEAGATLPVLLPVGPIESTIELARTYLESA